jgi:excisionase family DNA binding protein
MSRGAIPVAEGRRNGDDFYSPAQAARVLGVTPTRVRQLLQAGELEGERDRADHWSIPASAVVDRLDRLRRERFVEAAGYDPVSARELQERAEVLQRELGRLEGRLESEENSRRYLEADRALLAKRLERERLRREEVERERDELLRWLEVLGGPPSVEEATAGEAGREVLGQADASAPMDAERRSWWRSVFGRHRSG